MESSRSVRLLLLLAGGRIVPVIADRVGGGNQGSVYRAAGDYPCILKVFGDVGHPSGSVFRRLHRAGNRRNTIAMALKYLVQVLSQLMSLSEAGAVHSDVKADNIAISQRLGAVLIDFGFAMEATAPPIPGDPCGVMVDTLCGMTATHVAPEAIDAYLASFGEGALYDAAKADVYACGVTLFEWVFGSAPYSPLVYRHDIGSGRHADLPRLDRTQHRVAAAFDERVPELNGRVPDALIERLRTVCTGIWISR
ncbi:hypothetical protein FNF28_07577 [Cafeteria roenbergensis]|uniref:Protein kinase domain-containing protein n=1 Tax=Cafeteria roenbergensis TaxID=33653 RepID=A0A5A8C2N7_CAFRO|nr:hypothetical protein FNF28_07577 [Cafeteria roenbergensis]